jgi:hypothetical protein
MSDNTNQKSKIKSQKSKVGGAAPLFSIFDFCLLIFDLPEASLR